MLAGSQPSPPGQVIASALGTQVYRVWTASATELVDRDEMTPIPDAPAHAEKLIDLRGSTIIGPRVSFETTHQSAHDRGIVFDNNGGETNGWLAGAVRPVAGVTPEGSGDSTDNRLTDSTTNWGGAFVLWPDPAAVETAAT